MNNWQLKELLRQYPVTICAADQVRIQKGSFVISNTDTRDGPGKHWVTFYFPVRGPYEFFDSLGRKPMDYDAGFETILQRQYFMNCDQLQRSNSDMCGLYCVYYVMNRSVGMSMKDIVKPFQVHGLKRNDDYIETFLKKNK